MSFKKVFILSFLLFLFTLPNLHAEGEQLATDTVRQITPMATRASLTLMRESFFILKDGLGVLWLPFGAVESTVGAPFGLMTPGIQNMGTGLAAPFKVAGGVLGLPFKVLGAL
jgi:hypothetical protein